VRTERTDETDESLREQGGGAALQHGGAHWEHAGNQHHCPPIDQKAETSY
jgi:hypothetical protein